MMEEVKGFRGLIIEVYSENEGGRERVRRRREESEG